MAKKTAATTTKVASIKSCDCIVRPILTEETMNNMQNLNKITVEVLKGSNKIEIKNAFESLFGVKVKQVNTSTAFLISTLLASFATLKV